MLPFTKKASTCAHIDYENNNIRTSWPIFLGQPGWAGSRNGQISKTTLSALSVWVGKTRITQTYKKVNK